MDTNNPEKTVGLLLVIPGTAFGGSKYEEIVGRIDEIAPAVHEFIDQGGETGLIAVAALACFIVSMVGTSLIVKLWSMGRDNQ